MVEAEDEDIISNAEVLGEIDEGSFGIVYKILGEDGIEYAAKFVKKGDASDNKRREAAESEFNVMGALNHANLC